MAFSQLLSTLKSATEQVEVIRRANEVQNLIRENQMVKDLSSKRRAIGVVLFQHAAKNYLQF